MQGKPIQGFEEDYYITENGDIIDLDTGKLKSYYIIGNERKPRVDLYKEGIPQLSMYVVDVLVIHFFGKFPQGYYTVKYKDNDVTNLSLSNLEIITKNRHKIKSNYVKKLPLKGTVEYRERKMKQLEEEYVKYKINQLEIISVRDNIKCTVTYEGLKDRFKECNYRCEISGTPLTFERNKDDSAHVKRIGGRYEDITFDNIIIRTKRMIP